MIKLTKKDVGKVVKNIHYDEKFWRVYEVHKDWVGLRDAIDFHPACAPNEEQFEIVDRYKKLWWWIQL